jgi:hypothetical protein
MVAGQRSRAAVSPPKELKKASALVEQELAVARGLVRAARARVLT